MTNIRDDNSRKTRQRISQFVVFCFIILSMYIAGFMIALRIGPSLGPKEAAALSIVYWPLIQADVHNIEPLNSLIEYLNHRHAVSTPLNSSGKTMQVPAAPPRSSP